MAIFQSTLAFAPTPEDLDEDYFGIPVLTFGDPEPVEPPAGDGVFAHDSDAANIQPQRQIA